MAGQDFFTQLLGHGFCQPGAIGQVHLLDVEVDVGADGVLRRRDCLGRGCCVGSSGFPLRAVGGHDVDDDAAVRALECRYLQLTAPLVDPFARNAPRRRWDLGSLLPHTCQ